MLRDIRTYLADIKKAGEHIQTFTHGKTQSNYEHDVMLRSAVERQFTIIGEALGQALKMDEELEHQLPDIRVIIAFRNRLIHGYALVKNDVVWGVIVDDLPRLLAKVDTLLTA